MRNLAAFIVAAAAWCPTGASALTIEAEQARIKTVGIGIPGGWNLFSNGHLGDSLRFAQPGTYEITVRARGSPLGGVWPAMALLVDGQQKKLVTVDRKEDADYSFQAELSAGVHGVAVAFTNDAFAGGEDRNPYLDRIEVRPPQGAPEPVLVTAEEMAMEGERQEEAALTQAQADIERNRKGEATLRVLGADGKPAAGASVAIEQTQHDFLFGCNIYMFDRLDTPEKNEAYKKRFAELFNYATTGFYWRGYEQEQGKPHYAHTDKVVAWCADHGLRLKGHPLLWDHEAGIPAWSKGQPTPEIQKRRVADILRRYSGKIEFWEVVNEPAHVRGVVIDEPYRWAREADPKAYLIVNDYHVMADGFPPFLKLLEDAKRNGVPFDGIGIQAHEPRTTRFPLERVRDFLSQYATLGKGLHITEFTPCSSGEPIAGSHRTGQWDEAAQADYAEKFYRVCFAHPAAVGITWWDLCDTGSWLKGGGMLRADLSPKPVYAALRKLIHEEWHTRVEGKTDGAGRLSFRGFFGQYQATASWQGRSASGKLHLAKGAQADLTLTLAEPPGR